MEVEVEVEVEMEGRGKYIICMHFKYMQSIISVICEFAICGKCNHQHPLKALLVHFHFCNF